MSIFGKKAQLMNVCPKITLAELWKRSDATFVRRENPKREAFAVELAYGAHQEMFWLQPGEMSEPMDPIAAKSFAEQHGAEGVIYLDPDRDLLEQRLEGLEQAASFYNERGDQTMLQFDVTLNDQQRRLMRSMLQPIRINQEREKVLREFMDELRLELDTRPGAAVA